MSKAFFEILERRFGRFVDLHEPSSVCKVLTSHKNIDSAQLHALINHECVAIHVKEFYNQSMSEKLAKKLLLRDSMSLDNSSWEVASGRGMESTDVRAVGGTPFSMVVNAARNDKTKLQEYFNETRNEINWLRNIMSSSNKMSVDEGNDGNDLEMLSPLDKLRLELDECWSKGATLLKDTKTGLPYLPGIGRIMNGPTQWTDGFVHVDELSPLDKTSGLFSANIYLQLPPVGGEIHIWGVSFKNRWDFYRHASTLSLMTTPDEPSQNLLRSILPKPIRIKPDRGDLIMICTQRPHAVQGFPIGKRVSLQSFITNTPNCLVIDN